MEEEGRKDQESLINNSTSTSKLKNHSNIQIQDNRDLCQAHPYIVEDIQEIKTILKEVKDYILLRKKVFELIYNNIFVSGIITGAISGIIVLLVAYYTFL